MRRYSRRIFLAAALASTAPLALGALSTPARATGGPEFSRDVVVTLARNLAAAPYEPRASVPQDWQDQSYEEYQTRWFRSHDALWSKTPRSYNVDFFLPGLYFPRPIVINTVENGIAQKVAFDISLFDKTDKAPELSIDESLGYSGFRLRTELQEPGKKNEFCVFQGASYFRAIGALNTYGLSARGLAVNTADPKGEEFPEFTAFWLETPVPGQRNMVVHALMDSPSVTGAYRFDILPGQDTVMDVEATIFAREELDNIGLGPLTSMFLFDQTNRHRFDDFRPAVHDSDGLLVVNGNGETLWRPLANPTTLQLSSFVDENPRGFGLMQRPRLLSDYEDLEAHYHKRPSLWVEPLGDWGKGAVTLVEIPADKEIYDNIVAYWRPRERYNAGAEVTLSYRLTWGSDPDLSVPQVINTAAGARIFGDPGRIMTIDFAPHPLFADGPDDIKAHITSPHTTPTEGVLQNNPETGGMRLAFAFDPGERDHVELRAELRKDGEPASEVWLYRWTR
ncbi:glucan biosynthesis protein [Phaeobacter porticola]|uniref:Glucans biosynthesis protein G n=1 Tax=Phaeobacter porticola TaxID=1844006 RepID=A0A1L3I3L8_9RHOB|nr:glucan biosynthesis protein [Phaeobacter porticola]APG46652.1 glucans biosynthesis protein G [Phaeobacter porticola]